MISGGSVPSDQSEPQRAPAWPEVPPAWPDASTGSFTPTVRSFVEAAPSAPPVPPVSPPQPATASRFEEPGPMPRFDRPGPMPGFDPPAAGPRPDEGVAGPRFDRPAQGSPFDRPAQGSPFDRPAPGSPFDQTAQGSPFDPAGPPRFDPAQGSPFERPAQGSPFDPQGFDAAQRSPFEPPRFDPAQRSPFEPQRFDPAQGSPFDRPAPSASPFDRPSQGSAPDPSAPSASPFDRPGPMPRFDGVGFGGHDPSDPPTAQMAAAVPTAPPSAPSGPQPGPQGHQSGPQTAPHFASQPGPQPGPQATAPHGAPLPPGGHQAPGTQPPQGGPGGDDPYKPFVTAGQISGPKTPPAHRQQELWNTVFGENYRAMDEYDEEEGGRPFWLYALIVSVVIALVGALVWAFVAGPLSSGDGPSTSAAPEPTASSSAPAAKPQSQFPGLPAFKGTPSPVAGTLADRTAGISVPRLGSPWQVDPNHQTVQATYGFATRQFVSAGMTTRGKPEFAQVMTGPLPQALAVKYTTPDKLGPVLSAVMFKARQSLFPKGNKVTKVAQQRLSRNGLTGLLALYKVEADHEESTVLVAAVNTGADLPAVVYMAVPALKDDLLPDITTVVRSIRPVK
ncbi:hypothetical protein [Microbispora sp. ATCC PTA-5024]|uniref:hypothetical protein n=1 Tax=Microbispora sp. ATCC PTA-5024 TaxID=316330 RepID=UPI0003DDDB69|nr:hypothetical protein [Microbispora sp. ATCC PTA-5024]ETK32167.1 hypothetical protein MPTA5024_31360 [Microbispora sp. ATCC PTA-5024]